MFLVPLFLRGQAWLVRASLREAELSYVNLEGANLTMAHLEGATLRWAQLKGAALIGAQLKGATLTMVHLEGATLTGAHLEGADFTEAYLERTDFTVAHLEGANLNKAHLEGADFTGAYLEGANPEAAESLEDTKMNGVTGLMLEQREMCIKKGAIFDDVQQAPTSATSSPSSLPPEQSNDTQVPSAPSVQVDTPPPETGGNGAASSKLGPAS